MMKKKLISKVDGLSIRPSGPWINRKHFFLKRYADIFTRGMKTKWPLTYVDLFAGPGRCSITDKPEEVEGSPLIALNYEFDKYIFVEADQEDFEALKQRCSKSPKFSKIQFVCGDCNHVIDQIKPLELSLAFIDPTGIDIHFDTIRALADSRRVDLLMNIQFEMDIKRNFHLYQQKKDGSKLDLFLGGEVDWSGIKNPVDVIKLYKTRIRQLGYRTVEYYISVKNTKKVPMYFLFFASKNPKGLEFWNKITKKDETGQYELPL
jgi:three-Cys-motif partner protein